MVNGGAQTKKGAVGDLPPFALLTQTIARGFPMLTVALPSHRARRLNIRPALEHSACISFIGEIAIDGRTEGLITFAILELQDLFNRTLIYH